VATAAIEGEIIDLAAHFPSGPGIRNIVVGANRTSGDPMQVVSGPRDHEIVHYEAVASAAVRAEMHAFLEWFSQARPPYNLKVRLVD
jgi:hypothetical protein